MSDQCGEWTVSGAGSLELQRHLARWSLLFLIGLFAAPQALALGLGQAQVQSYLQQPLVARIDLISRSEAEMATVTAGLASPADFQVLGLTRAAISTPLEFEINRDLSDPHIVVTSLRPMDEPVVQLVVEVVWASGRMLRQYTLFLDPPTFDAPAPLPAPSARSAAPPAQEAVAEQPAPVVPEPEPAVELSAAEPLPEAQQRELTPAPDVPVSPAEPSSSLESANISTEVPAAGPPFEPVEDLPPPVEPEVPPAETADFVEAVPSETEIPDPVAEFAETPAEAPTEVTEDAFDQAFVEPERPAEPIAADVSDLASDPLVSEPAGDSTAQFAEQVPEAVVEEASPQPFRAVLPDAGQALPAVIDVEQGDTLWGLSGAYAEAEGVSRNQVMLAVQQKNPNAFIGENINVLMAGEILRMPTRDEMLAQDARLAMLEVMRQESLYRTRWDLPPSPDQLPTISNLADAGSGTAAGAEPGVGSQAALDSELPADELGPADPEQGLVSAGPEAADEDSRLVLVPPSENESEATQGMGQGGSGETGVSSGESVVEELARAREELANAEQEKAYLEERLAELEAELARREATEASGVADTNLAEMEGRLREDRLAGNEEPEVVMPKRESSWLSSYGPALAGLIVLALVTLVWFLRSRRNPEYTPGVHEPVSGVERDSDVHEGPIDTNGEESDDPETLLDLARAYMAMGKSTQARDCIEAVTRVGTPTQVREARTMLTDL